MTRRGKAGLAALVLLGALLRFGGLSHDLHEGRIYHPDVSKQMRAVQRFTQGVYYYHTGNKDSDGYPLLHSHIVEYFIRAAEPARRALLGLVGLPPRPGYLAEEIPIYWLMLLMNAALSTAIIPIVHRIGRENFSPGVAWAAAALQTISSTDVTSTHMATGDTATAFFAALSLLYAFRVLRIGRYRDYALTAATATFAFAAKYYAATAFFTLAAAHLFRTARPAAWFDRDALRRIGLAAAVAVGALFLADPSLFGNFRAQMIDIYDAMTKSTLRFPPELMGAGRWDRFVFSMRINLPDFIRSITPVVALASLLALLTPLRRDGRVWVLLVGPILYLLLAVGSRALVNPVYHTAVTPSLFLLTAFLLAAPWREGFPRARIARPLAAGALCLALALLGRDTAREVWFAWHMDTRRLVDTWSLENVPRSFRARASRYSFDWFWDDLPGAQPQGVLYTDAALAPIRVPAEAIALKRFALERAPLTQFRNVEQRVSVGDTKLLRPGFALPLAQRWPSEAGNQFILDNGVEFLRSEKLFLLAPGERLSRQVVTYEPLEEAWVAVQSPVLPATVRVCFGGRSETIRLTTSPSAVVRFSRPRTGFPTGDGFFFYRLTARSSSPLTKVSLGTRPPDAGRILANLGRHAEAYPLLARAALASGNPAAAAMAIVSARAAGREFGAGERERLAALAARVAAVKDDDTLYEAFGIRSAYLDALPFLKVGVEALGAGGFRPVPPLPVTGEEARTRELVVSANRNVRPRGGAYAVWTGHLFLDPGRYRGALLLRSASGAEHREELTLLVSDESGRPLVERPLAGSFDGRAYTLLPFEFEVPPGVAACSLRFTFARPPDAAVGGLEIRPDPVANAVALGAALRAALAP